MVFKSPRMILKRCWLASHDGSIFFLIVIPVASLGLN